jgi:hypothetical protein
MDATASGAQGIAGRLAVSDRKARGRTALPTVVAGIRRAARGAAGSSGGAGADGEVVWSWRPDAGVKPCGDASHQPVRDASVIRKATVATKPVTGESAE